MFEKINKKVIVLKISASREDYLNAIYILGKESGEARLTDIANYLNVKKSSANTAVNDLKVEGLVNYEKYKNITLTKNGLARAKYINKRTEIFKKFLIEILETDMNLADEEAERLAHCVSCHTTAKLEKFISDLLKDDEI